jgi:predicted transcriptional regulator
VTTTVRVSTETHARLAAISAATGRRMQVIVDDAIAAYESTEFWRALAAGYDALAADSTNWAQLQAERDSEASALADDLG